MAKKEEGEKGEGERGREGGEMDLNFGTPARLLSRDFGWLSG